MRQALIAVIVGFSAIAALSLVSDTAFAYSPTDSPNGDFTVPGGGGSLIVPDGGFDDVLPQDNPDAIDPDSELSPTSDAPSGPVPPVHYGTAKLPAAVAATRDAIIAAAKTGKLESLRPLLKAGSPPTAVSTIDGGDPIDIISAQSGDPDGIEMLAIMLDVLDAGWVVEEAGTDDERYVWPYFAAYPINNLTPPQLVELFQIMTAGDFEGMKSSGSYEFYRVEIGKDGRWQTFMAGE